MNAEKAQAKPPELVDWSVEREIGSGGSGTVFVVRDRQDGHRAALKVPAAGDAWAEGTAAEITALASMRHEHIVELIGTVPTNSGEGILMEYLPGGSVADLISARGPVALGEAVTVLAPIASAVAYLHDHGGVHGDIAPGNVLFTAAGMPKLADLGLAVLVGGRQSESGTPGFRAPTPESDDSQGRRLRPARDVYSLGALAWYLVTGRIAGPTHQRPPLSSLLGRVPNQLVELLEDALAEDEGLRPTAAEFGRRVFDAATPQPVNLRAAVRPEALGQMVTQVVADPAAGSVRSKRWRRAGAPRLQRGDHRIGAGRQSRSRAVERWLNRLRGLAAPGAPQGARRRPRGVPVVWVAAAVAVVVAAIGTSSLFLSPEPPAALAPVPTRHSAPPVPEAGSLTPSPMRRAAPGTGTGGQSGNVLQEAAFRQDVPKDPLQAVGVLAARRDLALSAGDPRALREVHAVGGASLGADLATASQLRSKGLRYAGLATRLSAESLYTESQHTGSGRDTADVSVTSTISPYRIVGADGSTVERIEKPQVQHLVLRLSRHDGGWLISGVFEGGKDGKTGS